MSDGAVVALRDLNQPDSSLPESPERKGELVSSSPVSVELQLTDGGAPITSGTLVGVQTSETVYLGRVESGEIVGNRQRLRVRVDHWLSLQDVSAIQKRWSQEQPD